MNKRKVYIVRTNYNRPRDEAWMDGGVVRQAALGSDRDDLWYGYIGDAPRFYKFDGKELERKIQQHRPGKPITPCIEVGLDGMNFHETVGDMHLTVGYGDDIDYQRFKEMVLLQDVDVKDGMRYIPKEVDYLDLILVYENCDLRFLHLVEGLKTDQDFDVTDVRIMRPI